METKPEGLEQAEHRLDPFDRRVAMTMAIIAAVLAFTTMMSHREHTESLSRQADANRLTTQANINHTEASDQWGYYQAKNSRSMQLDASLELLSMLAKAPGADAKSTGAAEAWRNEIAKDRGADMPALKSKAEALVRKGQELELESEGKMAESYAAHRRGERLDLAELCVELALVLCSIAVLTKLPSFWFGGIGAGVAGTIVAASAYLIA